MLMQVIACYQRRISRCLSALALKGDEFLDWIREINIIIFLTESYFYTILRIKPKAGKNEWDGLGSPKWLRVIPR